MGLSIGHMIVLLIIVMIFFGVGRLPDVLGQLGKGIREFKDASEGVERKPAARRRSEDEADLPEDAEERAMLEEFRRKRRESKQIAQDVRPAAADTDDADGGGDNDDAGAAPRSKSRSG